MSMAERRSKLSSDVLVIDDEDDIRELLELSFLRMGFACETAASVSEAKACLENGCFRLCLTDMRLPDGDGLELVELVQQRYPELPIAVISAYGSIETAIRALKLGAFDFITKPIDSKVLQRLVGHALKLEAGEGQQEEPSAAGAPPAQRLIGDSPPMRDLKGQLAKLARNQAPVFIHGESGTGKEVIARVIHDLGPRAKAPFIPINCGAVSPDLMESELFGYCKGSFTGATTDKEGLFRAANGGTLFLDEVGELPLAMQVKLLRAIQERAVRPVGGHEEVEVDVRLLSASHRDLSKLVSDGSFRQDLFFRINVISLKVPPLRERQDDIPALITHILKKLAQREKRAQPLLTDAALSALCAYHFPGNVRELENLLERAYALCDQDTIQREDLQFPESPAAQAHAVSAGDVPAAPLDAPSQETDAEQDERQQVIQMLEETRWNRSKAARRLGMTLRQLRYRLQKWNLDQ